jgi:hypothetical protein
MLPLLGTWHLGMEEAEGERRLGVCRRRRRYAPDIHPHITKPTHLGG